MLGITVCLKSVRTLKQENFLKQKRNLAQTGGYCKGNILRRLEISKDG